MVMELAHLKETAAWDSNNNKFIPNDALMKEGQKFIAEPIVLKIIKDVLQALNYLHNEKIIIHRDIKP